MLPIGECGMMTAAAPHFVGQFAMASRSFGADCHLPGERASATSAHRRRIVGASPARGSRA
jgi:hypothetical protein